MSRDIVILGDGGHARVVDSVLRLRGLTAKLHATPDASDDPARISDADLLQKSPTAYQLANGVGGAALPSAREQAYRRFKAANFEFLTLLHPSAIIDASASIDEGAQIMAGAVIQPFAKIGQNVIVNTRAVIEHDCTVEDHAHVASGAVLAGGVRVGRGCLIGAGAIIRQGLSIGPGSLIAAGAVVVADVPAGARVAGVPARQMPNSAP